MPEKKKEVFDLQLKLYILCTIVIVIVGIWSHIDNRKIHDRLDKQMINNRTKISDLKTTFRSVLNSE